MLKKIALLGAAVAALASTSANAATIPAQAEVDILAAVTVAQMAALDFGVVAAAATPGTVTIATSGTRTCSAGLACAGTSQRGVFNVTGANTYTVTITVDSSTTLDDGPGPGAAMTLALTPSAATVVAAGTTPVQFHVGGTLTVGAAQAAGTYTGSYNVSADYQ